MTPRPLRTFTLVALAVLMLSFAAGCDKDTTPAADAPAPDQLRTPDDTPDVTPVDPPAGQPTPAVSLGAAGRILTVTISPAQFSDIYPAVWFSPSTGEISPLLEESETPPAPHFEVWIEPGDPEFALSPDADGDPSAGLVYYGEGDDFKTDPSEDIMSETKIWEIEPEIADDMANRPVFYIRGMHGACVIQLLKWDPENEIIQFRYRKLD